MLPPQQFRIVSDTGSQPEAYIPMGQDPRSLAILRDLIDPSPETLERRRIQSEAHHAQWQAEREAEVAAHLTRHTAVLAEHTASPILTALLHAHAPQVRGEGWWTECDGCPSSWDEGAADDVQPAWPCPTWELISKGA